MNQSAEQQIAPESGPQGAIGALADSALSENEAQRAIDQLLQSVELRVEWDELHWVGDCLRSEETGALFARGDFMARFHEVLAAEPTVLAPSKTRTPARRWLRYGVPATAVVVSAVVWMAMPHANVAVVAQDAPMIQSNATVTPVAAVVDPAQLNEYLAAHQQLAATALHGAGSIQDASYNVVTDGGHDHP